MGHNPTDQDLPRRVLEYAQENGLARLLLDEPLVLGVSGGADSLAMLYALLALRAPGARQRLHVAHLDHGFRGEAGAADADFVRQVAAELGVAATVASFDVPAYAARRKLSSEDAARRVRYAFFASVAARVCGTVAVAHTADDQAETVLMHLLRGSGISGLAGMRPLTGVPLVRDDALLAGFRTEGAQPTLTVFRPLLSCTRREVEAFIEQVGVQPRTDQSNFDENYRRNRLRHTVLPALESVSPTVKSHLNHLAAVAAAEDDLLQEQTRAAWRDLALRVEPGRLVAIDVAKFAALHLALRRRVVRYGLEQSWGDLEGFTFAHIEEACQVLSGAAESPRSSDLAHSIRVERSGTRGLFYVPAEGTKATLAALHPQWPLTSPDVECEIVPPQSLALADGWTLVATLADTPGEAAPPGDYVAVFDRAALSQLGPLVLRAKRPGDRIRPLGMASYKKLQDLFVDAKIPREVRDRLPLLALEGGGGEVLWVPGPGGRRSDVALVTEGTGRVLCLRFELSEGAGRAGSPGC